MENVMTMTNGFAELSANEMEEIDGGFWGGVIVGCAVAWAVDGVVEYATGKSVGSWVSTGLHYVFD